MTPRRTFRFAPSPNGFLHLGHAYSALLNFGLARECGGRFLLRIEDIDRGRARPEYEAAIYEDLAWLGIEWETPVRRQSEHFADYAAALEKLDALGLLYACDCKRSDILRHTAAHPGWPRDPDGAPLYPETCREKPRRPAREVLREGGAALRLDMARAVRLVGAGDAVVDMPPSLRGGEADEAIQGPPDGSGSLRFARNDGAVGSTWREAEQGRVVAHPGHWGDAVLARKDTPASYHIAVVADDALQGVTDVVRGADLFFATSLHRLLQTLLELPEPAYRHHPLLLDALGEKLAKSRVSKSLRDLRAEGVTAAEVRRLAVSA